MTINAPRFLSHYDSCCLLTNVTFLYSHFWVSVLLGLLYLIGYLVQYMSTRYQVYGRRRVFQTPQLRYSYTSSQPFPLFIYLPALTSLTP